jgi:hypothetical protein
MGQVILVLGAFTLLIFLTMTVNQAIGNRIGSTYQAEAIIAATTLAQSMVNEASQKAFDDSARSQIVNQVSQLTPVASLGKEAGETYATFNDIDDFNNYTRTDTIPNGIFTTSVRVVYVSPPALNVASGVRTFYKKIRVTVTATELKNIPITLTRIVAY